MIKSFLASLGMFTKIKVRDNVFEDSRGAAILCFFPTDGLICGAASSLCLWGLRSLGVREILAGPILCLSLFLVSGFLHLDGFMDCSDALLSSRDMEGKRRILKDSSVGAFSVICVCLLLMITASSLAVIYSSELVWYALTAVPFYSRALFSVVLFTFSPMENNKGLLYYFNSGKSGLHVFCVAAQCALGLAASYFISPLLCGSLLGASALSLLIAKTAEKLLGGINGDVIGGGVILTEAVSYLILAVLL
ncbi:MAG: adenosylcobinamide-GDP ribazoletransferase [Eubacteriaceae bacterium]|nr:adenosylcobinamide-GDP ribazoletransferase [Eubacteriaceae bacterium]